MAYVRRLIALADNTQQDHVWLAFPIAVVRKMSNDQGGSLAALMAHYGFLSLFPLLLMFSAILGFVLGGDSGLRDHVIASTERSFPALSGFISETIKGSGLALGSGAFVALWGGLGVTRATERAMNSIWNIPLEERPNLWWSRVRGLLMLVILGATFLASAGLTSLQQTGGVLALPVAVLSIAGPLVLNFLLYMLAFQVLTNRHLRWRTTVPGAVVGAVGWTGLQSLGAFYTRHELAHASQLYGTIGWVVGLLAWIYLGAMLTLYAAEVNVVIDGRLWPRSLYGPPTTDADRRALVLLAGELQRAAGEVITVSFAGSPPSSRPEQTVGQPPSSGIDIHQKLTDLIVHVQAFDRHRQGLERAVDAEHRRRLHEHLHDEARETARAVRQLAEHDPILAEAIARGSP